MKSLLHRFLLFIAMLGLAGQTIAYASSSCAVMTIDRNAPIVKNSDCSVYGDNANKDQTPDKSTATGCLSRAGCSILTAVDVQMSITSELLSAAITVIWPFMTYLQGIDIVPEPHPPSILG